jgi:hypothetical protein
MEHTRIPLHKYQLCGKRDIGRPRRRQRDATILEAGTGDSPNPGTDDLLSDNYKPTRPKY